MDTMRRAKPTLENLKKEQEKYTQTMKSMHHLQLNRQNGTYTENEMAYDVAEDKLIAVSKIIYMTYGVF